MILSLALTTFNRFEMTIESFSQVIDDPRITDIVVIDDCSPDGSYEKLVKYFAGKEKVRVIRQAQNRGISINKRDAIGYCRNEWVIIFDSDNIIKPDYLDALQHQCIRDGILYAYCIYMPSFAKPQFDFRKHEGKTFGGVRTAPVKDNTVNMLFNCCNYVVNKNTYLDIFQHNEEMKGTDTVWFNYLWLKARNTFYVVPGMEYEHRVHPGSGFLEHADYNMKQSERIRKMIMAL